MGRFSFLSAGVSDKRQEVLLQAFIEMPELHKLGWELHLAGSLGSKDQSSLDFTQSLMKVAEGYPVKFHFNLDFKQLRNLYHQAAIYWHGKGYEYSLEEQPEKQEHFGITTVESMSAGAVPITFNSGGQREIVSHLVDGLLWNNLTELKQYTAELVYKPDLLKQLSDRAVISSKRYGKEAFKQRVRELVDNLLNS